MKSFTITIPNFKDGLTPGYWKVDYPKYGNATHAAKAKNINLFDKGYLGPGLGSSVLTNGTEAGVHKDYGLITAIDTIKGEYAAGGKYVYKIDNYSLVSDSNFPHEIPDVSGNKAVISDVILYQGNIYYTYYQSGGQSFGRYTITSESPGIPTGFDDDYMNTIPVGASNLENDVPHILTFFPDGNLLAVTNGPWVGTYYGLAEPEDEVNSALASGITASATSLTVTSGQGSKFPADNFFITIDSEILYCSTRNGDTFTVERGKKGTTAAAHNSGATVRYRKDWIDVFDAKAVFLEKGFIGETMISVNNYLWIGGSSEGSICNGKIFCWDGNSEDWSNVIPVNGVVGALFSIKNSIFVIYRSGYYGATNKQICKIGQLSDERITDLVSFLGTLPTHHKVTNFRDGVAIEVDGDIYYFGPQDPSGEYVFFPFSSTDYNTTIGCIKNTPYGFFHSSENNSGNRKISYLPETAGQTPVYKTDGYWKSILVSSESEETFFLKEMIVRFSKLTSGQVIKIKINYNEGSEIEKTISYAADGPVTKKRLPINTSMENFRVEIYWTGGSTSSPALIKSITIKGHYIT